MAAQLPPIARKLLEGQAPEQLRRAVASGAAPMPPPELVSAMAVVAAKDPDPELRTKARASLAELPANVKRAAVAAPLAPPVFRVVYTYGDLDREALEALVLNPDAPDDLLTKIAAESNDAQLLEIVAGNQQRLLRHTPLVEALLSNPTLGPATKSRVEEFFARAYAGKVMLQEGLRTAEELAAEEEWDRETLELVKVAASETPKDERPLPEELVAETEAAELDEEEAETLLEAAAEETGAAAEAEEEAERDAERAERKQEKKQEIHNLRKALAKMTVAEKIKLALMGNKEARSLLVFDANKVVSALVLKNPRLTEQEAEAIARSKSVRDDILRGIARDRRFAKSYSIKKALVENPKTPPAIAMSFLSHLRENDLKHIAKSKSVSSAVRQQAKRLLQRKQRGA